MRKITNGRCSGGSIGGPSLTAGTAQAAQSSHDTTTYAPTPTPVIQPLDCDGTTGSHGCGPGWYWRDGERGWACYVC